MSHILNSVIGQLRAEKARDTARQARAGTLPLNDASVAARAAAMRAKANAQVAAAIPRVAAQIIRYRQTRA